MSLPPLLAGLCGEGVMLDWLALSLALTVIAVITVMEDYSGVARNFIN